ncbi:MAG: hypothetical protein AAF417_07135 [Pseudomonadota bacterium]
MRQLRQLSEMLDSMPVWLQFAIAVGLVAYSFVSVYGRFNLQFGAKAFSKIPKNEIRKNKAHIVQYTVIPLLVTVGYLGLLITKYTS